MRGYIHYADEDYEVEAEAETAPKVRRPMSDARFRMVCRLIAGGLAGSATIAAALIAGFPGLMMTGMIDVILIAVTCIDD